MSLAAPVIEEHEGFLIVRDDLIAGGTKRRALECVLGGVEAEEVVYPATAQGYGQLALAHAGRDAGKKVTLFAASRKHFNDLMLESARAGAEYKLVDFPNFMNVVVARARDYCEKTGAHLMPLGFNTPDFVEELVKVAQSLPVAPKEVWLAAGSGTLTRAFAKAWPKAQINAVSMNMRNADTGTAKVWSTREKFTQKAKLLPPYPSAPHYDAKVWQFVKKHGRPGALVWNVGR